MLTILPYIILAVFNFLVFYLLLPTISIHNALLWLLVILDVIFLWAILEVSKAGKMVKGGQGKQPMKLHYAPLPVVAGVLVVALIVSALASSKMFNARAYSNILEIHNDEVISLPTEKDLPKIPLMDTESARVLGNRRIGSLSNVVSQYEVSYDYMTISYQNRPVKVSPLVYAGLWKWNNNKSQGVPGYIIVEPNDLTAAYVELSAGMKYVPSAYFSQDLSRHIWAHYPTVFFEDPHFEIDENGKPYYVASIYEYQIGLFGGKTITGVFVVDPVGGEITRYGLDNCPEWVDIVYKGDYIAEYFDIYGSLLNGYWNSIFGQTGLIESATTLTYDSDGDKVYTRDFGYVVEDNDVHIYTGVTSVTSDDSNIGYLYANERTGRVDITYFESTDEDSVMRAAEGEVQEKGYRASFPSLLSINGSPAYVMVLKDNLGLVKMYAIVDAAQYSHMVVNDSLNKAISLFTNGSVDTDDMKEKTITISRIEMITQGGETYVYIVDQDNNIYYNLFQPEHLLLQEGQSITILTDGTQFSLKN